MVTCRLKGGIGNLMFQIAGLEYFAFKNNFETFYYNMDKRFNMLKEKKGWSHSFNYVKMFENFNWPAKKIPKGFRRIVLPFTYQPIQIVDNVYYDAFFQSEKFFPDRNFILKLFEPSNFIKEKLKKYEYLKEFKTIAIHVRRGDFVKLKHIHPPQTKEYYLNAIKKIETFNNIDKYVIFSDDIKWCKNTFDINKSIFIENEKDYVEIFLQSQCNHNIISNSSFSWWGAYLNINPSKKVIAPKIWFLGDKYNPKDIVPDSWLKM